MTEKTRYLTVNKKKFKHQKEALLEELSVVKEVMESVSKYLACADCPLKETCDEISEVTHKELCSCF